MATTTTRLSDLLTKRDHIESQLGTGAAYVELEQRGRRVRRERALEQLRYLNEQIAVEERKLTGPTRNRARLRR